MFRIVVASESGESFERQVEADSFTLGRSTAAGVTLEDRFLSREHARLTRLGVKIMVEDLGSRNGTRVNDVKIQGPTQLQPGDRIGLSTFTVTVDSPAPETVNPGEAPAVPSLGDLEGTILVPAAELLGQGFELEKSVLGQFGEAGDELDLYLERLKLLDEVHRSLAGSASMEELLNLILDLIFDHLTPEEGVVILKSDRGDYETVARRSVPGTTEETFYSETLIREVADKRRAALVVDAQTDARFAQAESILASGVKSIVAAPLTIDDRSLGLIAMSSRIDVRQFGERDLELLGSLASVAALRLHNTSLAIDAAERQKLEAEVALARSIQEALLPTTLPKIPGYEVVAINRPSQGVSGDLYQVLETDSGNGFYLLLYDVSGKGLPASLLTATIEALSVSPAGRDLPPDEVCAQVNQRLESRTPADRFATAFLARLSPSSDTVQYANAGHNPALVIRAAGDTERLLRTGLPFGVLPESTYEAGRLLLTDGDLLVVYTDGITEATNPAGEEYGMDRLERFCLEHRTSPLADLALTIEQDVAEFAAGTPYEDDQTLLILKRTKEH